MEESSVMRVMLQVTIFHVFIIRTQQELLVKKAMHQAMVSHVFIIKVLQAGWIVTKAILLTYNISCAYNESYGRTECKESHGLMLHNQILN